MSKEEESIEQQVADLQAAEDSKKEEDTKKSKDKNYETNEAEEETFWE